MWRIAACGRISTASSVKINPALNIGEIIIFISVIAIDMLTKFLLDGKVIPIIKVEEDYFCKLLPESEVEKDESENQTKNSDDSADD